MTTERDTFAKPEIDVERAVAALANVLPILKRLACNVESDGEAASPRKQI